MKFTHVFSDCRKPICDLIAIKYRFRETLTCNKAGHSASLACSSWEPGYYAYKCRIPHCTLPSGNFVSSLHVLHCAKTFYMSFMKNFLSKDTLALDLDKIGADFTLTTDRISVKPLLKIFVDYCKFEGTA